MILGGAIDFVDFTPTTRDWALRTRYTDFQPQRDQYRHREDPLGLAVTTNPQLRYNAGCTVEPRFDSGTLTAVVTKNTVTTNVMIQFTACGQYTVIRS